MKKLLMPAIMAALTHCVHAEVPYIPGTGWQVFSWENVQIYNDNNERNIEGEFVFTVYAGQDAVLTVTDCGWNSEKFEIYNGNAWTGWTTSNPGPVGQVGGHLTASYDTASASSRWSHGSWPLQPGTYKLAFRLVQWNMDYPDDLPIRNYRGAFKVSVVTTPDTDGDGIADQFETGTGIYVSPVDTGTDQTKSDTDGDGLNDWVELATHATDPNKADTDGDGFWDLAEITAGKSPTNAADNPDAAMEILTAVEVTLYTKEGTDYRVEWSEDLDSWTPLPEVIEGDGNPVHRFYSIRGLPKRYFRAAKLPAP